MGETDAGPHDATPVATEEVGGVNPAESQPGWPVLLSVTVDDAVGLVQLSRLAKVRWPRVPRRGEQVDVVAADATIALEPLEVAAVVFAIDAPVELALHPPRGQGIDQVIGQLVGAGFLRL